MAEDLQRYPKPGHCGARKQINHHLSHAGDVTGTVVAKHIPVAPVISRRRNMEANLDRVACILCDLEGNEGKIKKNKKNWELTGTAADFLRLGWLKGTVVIHLRIRVWKSSNRDRIPVQDSLVHGQRRSMAATDRYRLVPRRLDHHLERWLCGKAGSECSTFSLVGMDRRTVADQSDAVMMSCWPAGFDGKNLTLVLPCVVRFC